MSNTLPPLNERIVDAMESSPHFSERYLRFEAQDGRVLLHGHVASFFQKQMAQEALRRIDGVREIDNRLEVVWPKAAV